MKKVFISQPMTGKSPYEILDARHKAVRDIESILGEEVEIIDSYFQGQDDENPVVLLGKSIELLAEADAIYFVSGWINSRGCLVERKCAEVYGIEILNMRG